MREIKFRAWVKDYALMADVNFLNIDYKEIVVMINENDYEFNCGEYELMQYTGLKDKNGTEIYEGDILHHPVQGKRKVYYPFDDRTACYGLETAGGNIVMRSTLDNGFLYEVIGNIYEHPHLLGD